MYLNFIRGFCLLGLWVIIFGYYLRNSKDNPYISLCHLVGKKIYLSQQEILPWKNYCLQQASSFADMKSQQNLLSNIQRVFSSLQVSHLNIFSEDENAKIWHGQARENGIESNYVDGDLIIFRVVPSSPSALAGLKKGDIILSINGENPNPSSANDGTGKFEIQRRKNKFTIQMEPGVVHEDQSITIENLGNRAAIIRVPSFRSDFFEATSWQKNIQKLKSYKKFIIDLRGNGGGNFVAAMRFLSPFTCRSIEVGAFVRPRLESLRKEITFADDLDDGRQIKIFNRSYKSRLKTFNSPDCLPGKYLVLVDSYSASSSELIAGAFREILKTPVWGNTSAGQLLVGIWYDLPDIGPGVRVSIPEAIYFTRMGVNIEKDGIVPDKTLYYNKDLLILGKDSWIEDAKNYLEGL